MSTPFVTATDKKDLEEGETFAPRFDANGLIVCLTVEASTNEPLMVAYMNAEALKLSEVLLQSTPKPGLVYRAMSYAYAGLGQKAQACEALRLYKKHSPGASDFNKVEAAVGCASR